MLFAGQTRSRVKGIISRKTAGLLVFTGMSAQNISLDSHSTATSAVHYKSVIHYVTVKGLYCKNYSDALSRDYNCDSTTIRLRYDDTMTHSTTTEVIEITMCSIRLRYDYDRTTAYRACLLPFDAIRREQKMNMSIFVVVMS